MKNDFNRNVLTLMTGTTIAQAIPIAISPILTRLYSPEDFGILAIFVAITAILGSIANARYELAIVLPEKDEDAINLTALAIVIATSFTAFLCVVILFFKNQIIGLLNIDLHPFFLFLIPLVVLVMGIYNALNYYNTRMKMYKNIASVSIYRSLTLSISQILFGILKLGGVGLVVGQIISNFTAIAKLGKPIWKDKKIVSTINKVEMKKVAKEYVRFPKYSIGGVFVNTFSLNINNFAVPVLFNSATLGFYSLVNRLLGTPTALIGSSISQVYFQKASTEKNEFGNCEEVFKATLKKLIVIAIPLFIALYIVIDNLIVIIFGAEWAMLETISKILMPLFFIRFISSTLSITLTVFKREKEFLIINLLILLFFGISIAAFYIVDLTIESFFMLQMILLSVLYFSLIFRYLVISKGERK